MNTLFGKKAQQAQRFLEDGTRIPVTLVVADGNVIMGLKNPERDHYTAVKLGFGKTKKTTKALFGEAKAAKLDYVPEVLGEVRVENTEGVELGATLNVEDVFKAGDIVDVTGTSKGKGFASGIKRYNFRGGPKTHGQSDRHRAPGSIGSGTTPGRVYKGKRMAGNMGRDTVTVKNLMIIDVNSTDKTLLIQGLVPGILNGVIKVTKVGESKGKNFVPLYKLEDATPAPVTDEVVEDVTVTAPAEAEVPVTAEEKENKGETVAASADVQTEESPKTENTEETASNVEEVKEEQNNG
jgi:large subunit ribosomal protein L3